MKKNMKILLPALLLGLSGAPDLQAQNLPVRIQVVVVNGEGVTTNVHERVAHDPTVRVEDEDHRPVPGAVVVFALPISGASGEFTNGAKNLSITTGDDGIAIARGLRTNDVPGKLQIYVTASYRGLRDRASINQVVAAVPGSKPAQEAHASKSGGKLKWILLGVAAAGGAGAAAYALTTRSSSPTAVSISTGTIVFGSPH
jgi:hypothetical protein